MEFKKSNGKHPVTNEPVVNYVHTYKNPNTGEEATFTVRASVYGIQLFGESPVVKNNFQLKPLAKVMGEAMKAHVRLSIDVPTLRSGH